MNNSISKMAGEIQKELIDNKATFISISDIIHVLEMRALIQNNAINHMASMHESHRSFKRNKKRLTQKSILTQIKPWQK